MAVTLTVGLFLTAPFFISLFLRSFFQSPNNFIICVSLLSKLNHHVQSKLKLISPNQFQFLLLKRIFKPWERKVKFKLIFFCDEYDSKNCNPRSLYKPLDRNLKLRLKFWWWSWQLQAYVAFQTLTQEPAYLFLWLIIADSFFVWQYFIPPIEWCFQNTFSHPENVAWHHFQTTITLHAQCFSEQQKDLISCWFVGMLAKCWWIWEAVL